MQAWHSCMLICCMRHAGTEQGLRQCKVTRELQSTHLNENGCQGVFVRDAASALHSRPSVPKLCGLLTLAGHNARAQSKFESA